jgi:hypothetical protein
MSQTVTVTRLEQVVRVNPATQRVTVVSPPQVVRAIPSGPPGPPGASGDEALQAHITSDTPHPAYDDDIVDLVVLFENGMA